MTHSHKGMSRAEADATLGKLLYQKRGRRARKKLRQTMKAAGHSQATIELYLYAHQHGLGGFRVSRPS